MVTKAGLNHVLDKLPGLKQSLDNANIDLFETDDIHIFGFGSLPSNPHYTPDENSNANLEVQKGLALGWQRDLCCMSVRSGDYDFPGLTLGLEKNPEINQAGGILTYQNLSQSEKIDMLEAFFKREHVSELPIYSFTVVETEREDGKKIKAIACIADQNSPGYAGHFDKEDRTTMIASALNLEQNPPRTSFSYFTRFVVLPFLADTKDQKSPQNAFETRYQEALKVEKNNIMQQWEDIEDYRDNIMPEAERHRREVIELTQAQNFHSAQISKSATSPLAELSSMYLHHLRLKTGIVRPEKPSHPDLKASFSLHQQKQATTPVKQASQKQKLKTFTPA